ARSRNCCASKGSPRHLSPRRKQNGSPRRKRSRPRKNDTRVIARQKIASPVNARILPAPCHNFATACGEIRQSTLSRASRVAQIGICLGISVWSKREERITCDELV